MKTKIKFTAIVLLLAVIMLSVSKASAQAYATSCSGPPDLIESTSGTLSIMKGANVCSGYTGLITLGIGQTSPLYMLDVLCNPSIPTKSDINVSTTASIQNVGYRIGGNHVLWLGSGTDNTMVGMVGTNTNPGGTDNTLIGYNAGNSLLNSTLGAMNTFVGSGAGFSNTSQGSNNTAVGYQAFYTGNAPNNTAIGYQALFKNSNAANNTATGFQALYTNVTGTNNTADGDDALYTNYSGISNTAIGYQALYDNSTGSGNAAIGNFAGYNNTESWNTFIGDSAGWDNTSGIENTYLGYQAGGTTAWSAVDNTVWIGYQSGPASPGSNFVYLGNTSTTWIESNNGIFTTWSDRRAKDNIQANVPGLAFITKITPVTFHYNVDKENQLLGVKDNSTSPDKYNVEKITQSGFIAQQVDSVAQACGYDFNGVIRPQTSGGLYSIAYTEFVVPLVKAVQELNAKNDSLNAKNNSLNSTVDSLRSAFNNMQACLNQICAATGNSNVNSNPAGEQNVTLNSANSPILYQNSPNPFNTGTKINYFLPEGTMGATIVFYDSYGNQIKTIALSETGNGTLNVTSDNLTNGIYAYSLIVNGTVIDTKKMVLQK